MSHEFESSSSPRVLSVYEGFFSGGARILHTDVLLGLQEQGWQNTVVSIHDRVYREQTLQSMENDNCYGKLRDAGIPVVTLGRHAVNGSDMTPFTAEELDQFQAQVDAADVVLSLKEQPLRLLNQAGELGAAAVIACLHRSDPENQGTALDDLRTAIESGVVDLATICATSAKQNYGDAGIPMNKLEVIANGIDLDRFRPSEEHRQATREQLGIGTDDSVVMFVARYDLMKNVPLFLESAGKYLAIDPSAHIVMCGAGMSLANEELVGDINQQAGGHSAILDRFHLLGTQRDMEKLYPAADIVALTSNVGEAAPLCLLEGMACGVIPVATDVGDTAEMLAGRGIITSFDADNIVTSWQKALAQREEFALSPTARMTLGRDSMVDRYAAVIQDTLRKKRKQDQNSVQESSYEQQIS